MKTGIRMIIIGLLMVPLALYTPTGTANVKAAEEQGYALNDATALEEQSGTATKLSFSSLGEYGELSQMWYSSDYETIDLYPHLNYEPAGDDEVLTAFTSDPEVAFVEEIHRDSNYTYLEICCNRVGAVTVTVSSGDATVSAPLIIYPRYHPSWVSVDLYSFEKVKVSWTPRDERVSGYLIQRKASGEDAFSTIKKVEGGSVTSDVVSAVTGENCTYQVLNYFEVDGKVIPTPIDGYNETVEFTAGLPTTSLTSVKRSGSYLVLNWKEAPGATGYKIYRSKYENDGYKLLKTVGEVTTYKNKATAGITWYYKIRPVFPGKTGAYTNSYGQIIPKKGSEKVIKNSKMIQTYREGRYRYWRSSSDKTYFYTIGSKLYAAVYRDKNNTLKIYGLDKNLKVISTKKVKLPNLSIWGGFYHGADGNNYVAMGDTNQKESETKTVIKVVKYDKNWKTVKSAIIKGGVSYVYKGIQYPFRYGNASFAMKGKILYLFTNRTMFKDNNGINHESNIEFEINTETMKAKQSFDSYVSHSFDQQARFKDGSLYLMDHGDGFPRAISLIWVDGYGTDSATRHVKEDFFEFIGEIGENETGCKIGGMEVGAKNILVCGTAQPHNNAVNGVTGFGDLKSNLFVTVTNRKTEKTTFRWLTTYNPKTTKVNVGESRMVKLSDDRFAILVDINNKLHYYLIDGAGKKLKHKKYSKIPFRGSTQPIVANGMIVWSETIETKVSNLTYKTENKICRIPVIL